MTSGRPNSLMQHAEPEPKSGPMVWERAIFAPRAQAYSGRRRLQLETPAGSAAVDSHLAGEVNILNLLAAFTAAHARGIHSTILSRRAELTPVPGRFQPVDGGSPLQ